MHMHRQLYGTGLAASATGNRDLVREIAGRHIGFERGFADQVGDMLQNIALGVESEMLRRCLVAPFDAPLRVKQHHAAGRRLKCGQKFFKTGLAFPGLLLAALQQAAHTVSDFTPHPWQSGLGAGHQQGRFIALL